MTHERRLQILVVDDDVDVVEVIELALVAAGYDVKTATSLDEARAAREIATPELVLCDWNLDGERSESFLRETKISSPNVTTILMTGSSPQQWHALLADGVVRSVIAKPFDLNALVGAVKADRNTPIH
jgi:hypothetical protein